MKHRPKLVVIGASYLQLPLVETARRMGVETHVFAWEQGAVARSVADHFYPISILEKDAILAEARKLGAEGVASIASDLAAVTVNHLAQHLGLPGNSEAATRQTTDKGIMRQALSRAGLPCPRFILVPEDATALPKIDALCPPLIVKPTDRSGSRGVTRVDALVQLEAAVANARRESLAGEILIEEFIEGTEVSLEALSWEGTHHHLAVTDKETTGPPHFVEIGHHQPSHYPPELQRRLVELTDRALSALGIVTGASHSEWRVTPEGHPYIMEIGARMGGDLIGSDLVSLSTGYDYVAGVVDTALGRFQGIDQPLQRYAGVRFVQPPPGIVTTIEDRCDDYPEILRHDVFVAEGDKVPVLRHSSERVAYYLYQAETRFAPRNPPLRIHTRAR